MGKEASNLKLVDNNKDVKLKALGAKLDKMVKSYTKEIKSEGEKYGIILDVKVAISAKE